MIRAWTIRAGAALVVAAVLALSSCAATSDATAADGSGAPVAPGTSAVVREGSPGTSVPACALPSAGAHTVDVGGTPRTFDVYPPGAPADPGTTPVLVLFHGFNSSKEEMATMTGLADQAPAAGVVLVVPQGTGAPAGWNVLADFGADSAFADALIAEVRSSSCVDSDDVWLAGFSAGSAFAAVYGCSRATQVAGLGLVSALVPALCPPDLTPNVVITHGTADPVVPFAGGDQAVGEAKVALPSVTDGATNWATHAGCVPEPTTATVGADVTVTQWRGCAGGSTITFQVIDGGGHAWPGAVASKLPGTTQTVSESCLLLAAIADPGLDPYPDCPGDGPVP